MDDTSKYVSVCNSNSMAARDFTDDVHIHLKAQRPTGPGAFGCIYSISKMQCSCGRNDITLGSPDR